MPDQDPLIDLGPLAKKMMGCAKEMKEKAVADEGIGADLPPIIYLFRDQKAYCAVPLTGDRDHTLKAIPVLIAGSSATTVVFVHEAWHGPDPLRSDTLSQRFAAGDPTVKEELVVMVAEPDRPIVSVYAAYRYTGRRLQWEMTQELTGLQGDYPDAVFRGWKLDVPTPPTPLPIEAFTRLVAKFLDLTVIV